MDFQSIDYKNEPQWLDFVINNINELGFVVVTNVLQNDFIEQAIKGAYHAYEQIKQTIGLERLSRAKELGMIRLPAKFSPCFFDFLTLEPLLAVVDALVAPTAIMHLQNAFIQPPNPDKSIAAMSQYNFHMDFPRVLNAYRFSVNTLFTLTDFTAENGGTRVVPCSQQLAKSPTQAACEENAISVTCPAGSMIVFDSTLWHSGMPNVSNDDRIFVNHQFTHSYLKQQIDYVRALGDETVLQQPQRTQQLLGYYTRMVTSLDEFYQPEAKRLYRKGQG